MKFISNSRNRKKCRGFTHSRRGNVLVALLTVAALAGFLTSAAQASAGAKTKLTLTAPTSVTAGVSFQMGGTLRMKRGGIGLKGRRISLYWQQAGSQDFIQFGSAKTNRRGGYTASLTAKSAGGGKLEASFAGSRGFGGSKAVSATITVAAPTSTPSTPQPSPAPAPSPTPAPTPSGPVFPSDPLAAGQTLAPAESSSDGITPGEESCETTFGREIQVTQPLVNSPTGQFVYAIDKLYARPNGTGDFELAASGEQFFSGTYNGARPVYQWANLRTGQPNVSSYLDRWSITPGYSAHIVQFVWIDGVWYYKNYGYCEF